MASTVAPLVAALASRPSAAAEVAPSKPFSEHRLTLQLSDRDPVKQSLVLSVAYNMLAIYEVDKISIEVVAFADGIQLLHVDAPDRSLVDSLIAQGVIFDACGNTIDTIERRTRQPFPLNPKARRVQAGVSHILALSEAGYTLVRP